MKRNKAIAFVLSTALFALALTACGSQSSDFANATVASAVIPNSA